MSFFKIFLLFFLLVLTPSRCHLADYSIEDHLRIHRGQDIKIMTDPSSNTASFQLKNVVDSISNSHQQSNLDSRFISDSISLISNNSLISSSHSQSSFDSNSSRVLKSYLSTTSSLLKINSSSSSSTTTSTSSNRYRILLSTLLATQFIQQLGLNHSLLSSSSNSTSLLEQWLNSSSNLLLSNSSSKNLILDDDSTISTQLLASILDLITNHLLGSKSGLKADYHRNVVVKNVPKLANGLLNLLDNLHHIVEQRGALDKETEKKMVSRLMVRFGQSARQSRDSDHQSKKKKMEPSLLLSHFFPRSLRRHSS